MRLAVSRTDPKTAPPATARKYCSNLLEVSFSGNDGPEQDSKENDCRSIVEKAFSSMMEGQPLVYPQILGDGRTEHGVRGRDDAPEQKCNEQGKPINQCTRYPVTRAASTNSLRWRVATEVRIAKQLPHVQLHAAFEDQRRRKTISKSHRASPVGTVDRVEGRQDRKLNDFKEQAAKTRDTV